VHTGETDSPRVGIAFTYRPGNDRFSRKRRQPKKQKEQNNGACNPAVKIYA
jgi:hypothetical protein